MKLNLIFIRVQNLDLKVETLNIKNVAALYKGKYAYCYRNKNNKERKLKFSYAPIKLPALKNTDLLQ